ncbi:MAG: hypothetical protein LBH91_03080 [Prevotellaceae bacterium]|jgi:phage gpG-like protein|nr:hypothetical protein [Prevotellaceae bacterium]
MTPKEFTEQLKEIGIEIQNLADNEAPVIAGKTAADFFTENFQRQGFLNQSLTAWRDVQRRTHPRTTPKGQTAAGRQILFGETRNLSRSIDYDAGRGKVTVYSDVKYAPYHNEGTDKLPKRQFIGDSEKLNELVISEINRKLKEIPKK